jgi:archaellum component FlaC
MVSWKTDEEAVEEMLNMAMNFLELQEKIHTDITKLRSTFDSCSDGLGEHVKSIEELIETVEAIEDDGGKDVKRLVLKLKRAALIRKNIIDNDRYSKIKGLTR